MGTKKTYYIEFGDGKNWSGCKEVVSDTRYSNAGKPIEDEMHALMAELSIHDKSIVTVRAAGDDRGFSAAPKTTIAILCVRVWAEEEEEEST